MKKEKIYFRVIGSYLALALFILGSFPGDVFAGFVPSAALSRDGGTDRAANFERIRNILETRIVSERMKDLGLSPGEVEERLSLLDDAAVHELATNIDLLQKGGDGVLGAVIALLIIAILVVVLLQLTGRKIIIE